jgi:uncharacterized protein (DUF362 family)
MDPTVKVAVVRSDRRRGAVAEALALIADDLRAVVAPRTLIKPNLVSHKVPLPSTHADTLSATFDAVLAAGARAIVVAEGATDATAGFARFGYFREAWGRPVEFLDLNRQETDWVPVELVGTDGASRIARVSRTVAESRCRVSLALAKTHVTTGVTLSLKNMLSAIHPADRVMMHGHAPGGNGYTGWKRLAVEFLKGDNPAVRGLTRLQGRLRNIRNALTGPRLRPSDEGYLRSVAAMHRNLVALNRFVGPHVSLVDGFLGMEGEGPRHGSAVKLGVVVAGTDPVAVDAVAAAVMGFDPRSIGFLALAHEAGLGTADLDAITVLGDSITKVRRRFVPHSNAAIQQHWRRFVPQTSPYQPHVGTRVPEHPARR